jgi:anti-sigma factor RsiW
MTTADPAPLFGSDGHLEEWVLVALADGEDAFGASAEAHLTTCEACTERLVSWSAISIEMGERLAEVAGPIPIQATLAAKTVAPLPVRAVTIALVVAIAVHVPFWTRLPALLAHIVQALAHAEPVLVRGLSSPEGARLVLVSTLAASTFLIACGFVVAHRSHPQGAMS